MSAKSIELISPDNTPIVGALLEDGSICNVSLTYNEATALIDIVLEHNGESPFLRIDDDDIYIDENGRKWPASTVVDHSLFNSNA